MPTPVQSTITNSIYDTLINKSYIREAITLPQSTPVQKDNNMIDSTKMQEFHYQTLFYLNFYATLNIELLKRNKDDSNDVEIFKNHIDNLKIKIDTTTAVASIFKLSSFDNASHMFTFYVNTFEADKRPYKSGTTLTVDIAYEDNYESILLYNKPYFGLYPIPITASSYKASLFLNINDITLERGDTFNRKDNTSKIKEIITEIFNIDHTDIRQYLYKEIIKYSYILYNISIQDSIRRNFLNNDSTSSNNSLLTTELSSSGNSALTEDTAEIKNIINTIKNNTQNLSYLNNYYHDNYYIDNKKRYTGFIKKMTSLKKDYHDTEDKLNIFIRMYNENLKKYNTIKKNSVYIIIALIIIIIFIIFISIFPIFSSDTNNAIYIILLVILNIITFLYYTNIKSVNLYENFTVSTMTSTNISAIPSSYNDLTSIDTTTTTKLTKNNIKIYNLLMGHFNLYINTYVMLNNNVYKNSNTIGDEIFSKEGEDYLMKLYKEKKLQLEENNIKIINFKNTIELIKKQITFLFNIIFVIACITIIILLGLVLYSTVPYLLTFIIILCIVLITILMIYFAFAIVQPTRMISNKNYWASVNPPAKTLSKL